MESILNSNISEEWLDFKSAAKYLGITENNLRIRVHRGQMTPSGRLGKLLKFKREDLDNYLIISNKERIND
ncbi:MAG: hypothetical protein CME63_04635 [Halobacteriovoraceae bacterium]|nr:hypothetical protein [Halobacteriovoraceae bacterium]|tara:strand:+ start:1738 stop:1950 length:213 start_codon:yes stop_codon:yes gene_type:complete